MWDIWFVIFFKDKTYLKNGIFISMDNSAGENNSVYFGVVLARA